MSGRISSDKDFCSFFKAASHLNVFEPVGWKFVTIGTGEEIDQISFKKLTEDLKAAGVVDFPQPGVDVLPYLQEADVGLLLYPSYFIEVFSNSIMEYMICKLPVICTDGGDNKELVVDGETGYVIPPADVDSFIDRLLFLKNHPDIPFKMGNAG